MKTANVKNPKIRSYSGPGGYSVKNIELQFPKASCSVGFYDASIPEGKGVDAHYHAEQDELFYFLDAVQIRINDEVFDIESDSVVYVAAGDEHELLAPTNDVRYIVVRLPFDPNDKVMTKNKIIQ